MEWHYSAEELLNISQLLTDLNNKIEHGELKGELGLAKVELNVDTTISDSKVFLEDRGEHYEVGTISEHSSAGFVFIPNK